MICSVVDVVVVLIVIVGCDDVDLVIVIMFGCVVYDYIVWLDLQGLCGKCIGLLQMLLLKYRGMLLLIEYVVIELCWVGVVVVLVELFNQGVWVDVECKVLLYEFKVGLECYFSVYCVFLYSLVELIVFNQVYSKQELGLFGQELLVEVDVIVGFVDFVYICVCSDVCWLVGLEGIDVVFVVYQFDVLVVLIIGIVWLICSEGDDFFGESYSVVVVVGYFSFSVLMGQIDGLLVGLLFMGIVWSELKLIEMVYVYEQCICVW